MLFGFTTCSRKGHEPARVVGVCGVQPEHVLIILLGDIVGRARHAQVRDLSFLCHGRNGFRTGGAVFTEDHRLFLHVDQFFHDRTGYLGLALRILEVDRDLPALDPARGIDLLQCDLVGLLLYLPELGIAPREGQGHDKMYGFLGTRLCRGQSESGCEQAHEEQSRASHRNSLLKPNLVFRLVQLIDCEISCAICQ